MTFIWHTASKPSHRTTGENGIIFPDHEVVFSGEIRGTTRRDGFFPSKPVRRKVTQLPKS